MRATGCYGAHRLREAERYFRGRIITMSITMGAGIPMDSPVRKSLLAHTGSSGRSAMTTDRPYRPGMNHADVTGTGRQGRTSLT